MKLILYIDMDYFFAACEEARRPELKGKPLIVGTNSEKDRMRGVVQASNYEARKFGIHSAMPTNDAFKLCKELQYSPPDDAYYEEVSSKIMALLSGYAKRMETDSIDEAALEIDVPDYEDAAAIGKAIKEKIKNELGLPCTIGISVGKVLSKMVCDSAKPDGLKTLEPKDVRAFLDKKPVGKIPGVGAKTEERLAAMKIKTIDQLAKAGPMTLINSFGDFGRELYLIANGRDESRIVESSGIISIGRERTLEKQATDMAGIEGMAKKLTGEVMAEVKKRHLVFKTIGVKARYNDFSDKVKSRSLNNYSDSEAVVLSTATALFKDLTGEKPIRKIGVRVSSLISRSGQKNLF